MKNKRFMLFVLLFVLLVSLGCGVLKAQSTPTPGVVTADNSWCTLGLYVDEPDDDGRLIGSQYWKSTVPDSFQFITSDGPFVEISGKPWMWIGCDAISGDIITVQFGMTEVTWTLLEDSDFARSFDYPPDSDASTLPTELGLTGPIWIFTSSDIWNDLEWHDRQLSWLSICLYERWEFTYTSDTIMTGDVTNLDANNCMMQSGIDAFHLVRLTGK
jgi:hypothetical protein